MPRHTSAHCCVAGAEAARRPRGVREPHGGHGGERAASHSDEHADDGRLRGPRRDELDVDVDVDVDRDEHALDEEYDIDEECDIDEEYHIDEYGDIRGHHDNIGLGGDR